jgi:hypothetical protein
MGLPFAKAFVDFVGNEKGLPVKSIAKVESNPDQSKHLETAKTRVLDTELDFVNLRSEEYAEGSRIPTEVVITHVLFVFVARTYHPHFFIRTLHIFTIHIIPLTNCTHNTTMKIVVNFVSDSCSHKTFGTPLQDALRRDITINALFYNVHTRKVEDHTGQVS